MPSVVNWSPGAISDIKRLYAFLAEKDLNAAKAAAALLFSQAEILESFSNVGKPAADLEPEHRELFIPFGVAGYVLLYHADPEHAAVTVLAVRHQREVGY